jgi:hypothetical protein
MVALELNSTTDRRPAKEFDFFVSTIGCAPASRTTFDKGKSGFFCAYQATGSTQHHLHKRT